jgi:hypothetical protein
MAAGVEVDAQLASVSAKAFKCLLLVLGLLSIAKALACLHWTGMWQFHKQLS